MERKIRRLIRNAEYNQGMKRESRKNEDIIKFNYHQYKPRSASQQLHILPKNVSRMKPKNNR
jgi:hypothetical protein